MIDGISWCKSALSSKLSIWKSKMQINFKNITFQYSLSLPQYCRYSSRLDVIFAFFDLTSIFNKKTKLKVAAILSDKRKLCLNYFVFCKELK